MLTPELIKKIRRLHIKTQHLATAAFAGNYQSSFRGKGMEFAEVRAYVVGDDVRTIDWNVTARLGEPHIKIYQEERELNVMLLVDASASGLFGGQAQSKSEFIAEIAALLAFTAIQNNDKVGMLLFTDHVESTILPQKGRGHVWHLIRELLQFRPQQQRTNIQTALKHCQKLLRRRSVIFLISDFIDAHPYDATLRQVAKQHDLICLQVYHPWEYQLPELGILQTLDPESGTISTIDSHDPQVRTQFRQQLLHYQQQQLQNWRRSGADSLRLDCNQDYLPQLVQFFQQRERPRRR